MLGERFPEHVAAQPELVAHHYTEAGWHDQAADYWRRAGQQAAQRSAYVEASHHLTQGINQLTALPDCAQRAERELVEDTFRVLSISFSYMGGAQSIDEFLVSRNSPRYSYIIYRNLGDLYLEQERYLDNLA